MKLHDLRPPEGAHKAKTRVGRGIAAGKGKTAGRGTKGQKARAGGSIPPWFEGGQTPLHMRIPKLRGFKNRFRVEYEVVNVGAIEALVERGAFETAPPSGKAAKATKARRSGQITINQDILRAVGLVRTLSKPLKILGAGDLSAPLFVVADAFTASARTKIEAAGGIVNVLEIPTAPTRRRSGVEAPRPPTASGPARAAEAQGRPGPRPTRPRPVEAAPAPKRRLSRRGRDGTGREAAAPRPSPRPRRPPTETAAVEDAPPKAARAKSTKAKAEGRARRDRRTGRRRPPTEESDEAETTSGDDA